MRSSFLAIIFIISVQCQATETLDCTGVLYALMMHVGDDGSDFLSDVMLFKEGHEKAIEIYSNKDLHIAYFNWAGENGENSFSFETINKSKKPISIHALNEHGELKIGEKIYDLKCDWRR